MVRIARSAERDQFQLSDAAGTDELIQASTQQTGPGLLRGPLGQSRLGGDGTTVLRVASLVSGRVLYHCVREQSKASHAAVAPAPRNDISSCRASPDLLARPLG